MELDRTVTERESLSPAPFICQTHCLTGIKEAEIVKSHFAQIKDEYDRICDQKSISSLLQPVLTLKTKLHWRTLRDLKY